MLHLLKFTTINKPQMQDTCSESFLRQLYVASRLYEGIPELLEYLLLKQSLPHIRSFPCTPQHKAILAFSCQDPISCIPVLVTWQLIRPRAVIVIRRVTTKRSRNFSDVSNQASSCSDRFFRRRCTDDKASIS